jgi:hypothetical protein
MKSLGIMVEEFQKMYGDRDNLLQEMQEKIDGVQAEKKRLEEQLTDQRENATRILGLAQRAMETQKMNRSGPAAEIVQPVDKHIPYVRSDAPIQRRGGITGIDSLDEAGIRDYLTSPWNITLILPDNMSASYEITDYQDRQSLVGLSLIDALKLIVKDYAPVGEEDPERDLTLLAKVKPYSGLVVTDRSSNVLAGDSLFGNVVMMTGEQDEYLNIDLTITKWGNGE